MRRAARIILVTGNQQRHRHVASVLADGWRLAGIVTEAKPAVPGAALPADGDLIADHFRDRDRAERSLLRAAAAFPDVPVLEIPGGGINAPQVYEWTRACAPDAVVLYGTGLIRPPLLDICPGRMVNLHLGLSPWYRGAGTNFWPFVFGEPECVGATIHLAVAKVDAGPILGQVRPAWAPDDGIHEAGTKTLLAAAEALPPIVEALLAGEIEERVQDLSEGRVFRQKDFHPEAVRAARENLGRGLVGEYLRNRDERNRRFPIVEPADTLAKAGG